MTLNQWISVVLLEICLTSTPVGAEHVKPFPNKETTLYLGELLRRNEPSISDVGVVIAKALTPIELLFDQEVLMPRFGSALTRAATVTLIIELPEKSLYLTESRLKTVSALGNHYSYLPIEYVRAYAVVNETCLLEDGSSNAVTTIIEASFREQTDSDNDGKWDRKTCWEVVKSTRRVIHSKPTTARRGGNDKEPSKPTND